MLATLPAWPRSIPRVFHPVAHLRHDVRLSRRTARDRFAEAHALRLRQREDAIQNSFTTGTVSECLFTSTGDYTALASFTSEASLIAGSNEQPTIPALYFFNKEGRGRGVSLIARGVVSSTGTPTYTFQWRIKTTAAVVDGTSLGVSAAITTGSGITNQLWESRLDLICNTVGIGTGNTTLSVSGYVVSPGFAAPYWYHLVPSQGALATWTATLDNSLTQFINLSVTCSASSASNAIRAKHLQMFGLN